MAKMENYLVVSLVLVWSFCLQRSYSAESALHFKLRSGEEISCVSIYEQPSLKSLDHASNPYLKAVELSNEFSLSQLWITAGSYSQNNYNSIEVGWQVFKDLYGDDYPHLFVYWTRDAYNSTGCYNLACPGFVQISSNWVVGGYIAPFSVMEGTQYEMQVLVFLDQGTSAWWLMINGEFVGYWPTALFTGLKSGGTNVEWGGEITNRENGSRHSQTDMGSCAFAEAGFMRAAFIRSLQTVNQQNQLVDVAFDPTPDISTTNPNCYSSQIALDNTPYSSWRTYLFFGGPGYSDVCVERTRDQTEGLKISISQFQHRAGGAPAAPRRAASSSQPGAGPCGPARGRIELAAPRRAVGTAAPRRASQSRAALGAALRRAT
ncbi:hypothetical protein R1sor_026463 [Riccia sorocarpa]|uniref:Neprosin PEP catalytic domain-containing protein n=1 Tax=Riccia sorocarpa TaxID=122646 RepID=A0ABD3GBH6_9MARC